MKLVIIPAIAFVLCVLLHWIALKDFVKLKLLDNPEKYGLMRRKLPYPTGILSVLVFLAVGLVVFLVVGHEIHHREAVVRGDEIYAVDRRAPAALVHVGAAGNA